MVRVFFLVVEMEELGSWYSKKKETVSKVGDSLFLFGYLMETGSHLSDSQGVHFTFETSSFSFTKYH
jgi:hypothetical protein